MSNKALFSLLIFLVGLPQYAQAKVNDPCPEAVSALSSTPDDLSKVQADIDRFTLCVERAQLLKRLNDLALENEEDLFGVNSANPGFNLNGAGGANLPDFNRNILNITPPNNTNTESLNSARGSEVEHVGWAVLSVFGVGTDLSAKISKPDGTLAQIKAGDVLEDGTKILAITSVSVEVSEDGKSRVLQWLENSR